MFMTLLLVAFLLSSAVSWGISRAFSQPMQSILARIIADPISEAWVRYLKFAILVVGISSGVRISEIERYISPNNWQENPEILALTGERWVLEIYRTVIVTLQGVAMMLLAFFVISLVAFVVLRISELRQAARTAPTEKRAPEA
jgi:hypothetical protein